jgi:glycosyltransferase involved in cell wall biosynthesis
MNNLKELKVCMIVHSDYYQDARVRRYAEDLAENGAKVDIICLSNNSPTKPLLKEGISLYPVNMGRLYSSEINYLVEYLIAFVLYSFKLLFLFAKNHYQVIHVHNMPDFLVFTALIPRLFGAYVILDIHDPMPELYICKFGKSIDSPLVRLILFQEKISINFANAVIIPSHISKRGLVARGRPAAKISVVFNIPNTEIFDRQKYRGLQLGNHKFFTMVYPGTIAPRYGLDIPIRALPELIKVIPKIRLQIIGDHNSHVEELMALADDLNVTNHVVFEPSVDLDKVPEKLLLADVGIFTAHIDNYTNELTPGKVLEYVFMGIPVISVRNQALMELFDSSALLFFEPENVPQFVESVLKLHKDKSLGEKMVKNADEICSRNQIFSNVLAEYYQILEKV